MNNKHTCPECGSDNIFYSKGASTNFLLGSAGVNHILISQGQFPLKAAVDTYVCGNCGYVRSFISKMADLERITENWSRLNKGS